MENGEDPYGLVSEDLQRQGYRWVDGRLVSPVEFILAGALAAICTASDSGPWIEVYRAAGGGYEGLQAIAETALKKAGYRD